MDFSIKYFIAMKMNKIFIDRWNLVIVLISDIFIGSV